MVEPICVLRLSDDSDIFESLKSLAKENGIYYGHIVSACGKLKDFELVANSPGGGVNKIKFDKPFEINAMSGRIELGRNDSFSAHLRISVTSTGFTPVSGQLVKGSASGFLEIAIRKIDTKKIIEA